jgi:hypothetical protein
VRPTYWENLLSALKLFLVSKASIDYFHEYREIDFTYNPLPVTWGSEDLNIKFYGYFQSLKYFHNELPAILEILGMQAKISGMRERFPDTSKQACMHFRITGYREISDYHPVAPYEYYVWAISQICESEILYFNQREDADEVNSIVERLKIEFPGTSFIPVGQDLPDWEQLLLMACCQTHIIANSSFSWWGAILAAPNPVYYPSNWFGPAAGLSIKDLVLPGWHGY